MILYSHLPYIEIRGDEIITGYRCSKEHSNLIIILKFQEAVMVL